MRWTRETPTAVGWYWLHPPHMTVPECVRVAVNGEGWMIGAPHVTERNVIIMRRVGVCWERLSEFVRNFPEAKWSGPIAEPEEEE